MDKSAIKREYFNIALFAESDEVISTCCELARANVHPADGYLLGKDAWPHVTLCQFSLEESKLPDLWSAVENLLSKPILIRFSHIYILPGVLAHAGKNWLGLAVERANELLSVQKATYDKLLSMGIQSTTPSAIYFPHLTWGRMDGGKPISITRTPSAEFWQASHPFTYSIGRTDVTNLGIYEERLYPVAARRGSANKLPTAR